MSKFNRIDYNNQYNRDNYDRITVLTPRGQRDDLKHHAAAHGESLNAFMLRAAAAQIERDRAEDERRTAEAVTPPTVTTSEPETAGAEQSRPTSDGQQTAAEAPAEISTTPTGSKPSSKAEPEQDKPTATAPKSTRRGRRKRQTEQDPAQLSFIDAPTDGDSDSGDE